MLQGSEHMIMLMYGNLMIMEIPCIVFIANASHNLFHFPPKKSILQHDHDQVLLLHSNLLAVLPSLPPSLNMVRQ